MSHAPGSTVRRCRRGRIGGFDDWSGAALAYAVDVDQGFTLVAAMPYEGGHAVLNLEPPAVPASGAAAYEVDVPDSLAGAVTTWPMLGNLVADAAGVRGLPRGIVAVLALGDPAQAAPESLWVAVDGDGRLLRGDDPSDRLEAALVFVEVSHLGAGAEVMSASYGLALEDIDLEFPSLGAD